MRLFVINPDTQEVDLNKEWMFLVPEFSVLLKRDRGSQGDYRGDKKLKARKEFTYIYFMEDFTSPIQDWEDDKKEAEALRCASLSKEDIDERVSQARTFYHTYLRECAPSLRTLDSLRVGRNELNNYFRNVNFKERDKLGKAFYTAKEYIGNVKDLPAMNRAIKEYERMVEEELKENTGIRGKNTLGLTEGTRSANWEETGPPEEEAKTPKYIEV